MGEGLELHFPQLDRQSVGERMLNILEEVGLERSYCGVIRTNFPAASASVLPLREP